MNCTTVRVVDVQSRRAGSLLFTSPTCLIWRMLDTIDEIRENTSVYTFPQFSFSCWNIKQYRIRQLESQCSRCQERKKMEKKKRKGQSWRQTDWCAVSMSDARLLLFLVAFTRLSFLLICVCVCVCALLCACLSCTLFYTCSFLKLFFATKANAHHTHTNIYISSCRA